MTFLCNFDITVEPFTLTLLCVHLPCHSFRLIYPHIVMKKFTLTWLWAYISWYYFWHITQTFLWGVKVCWTFYLDIIVDPFTLSFLWPIYLDIILGPFILPLLLTHYVHIFVDCKKCWSYLPYHYCGPNYFLYHYYELIYLTIIVEPFTLTILWTHLHRHYCGPIYLDIISGPLAWQYCILSQFVDSVP